MKIKMNIPQKVPKNYSKETIITTAKNIFQLDEVQAIKGAVQEHLLFIGMNNRNQIVDISVLAIGKTTEISIDAKVIIRNALVNSCEKVVLVHNHPSNALKASEEDKKFTNFINTLLNCFDIKFLDHIIVTENGYVSMQKENLIDYSFENQRLENLDKSMLEIVNSELEKENKKLKETLEKYQEKECDYKLNKGEITIMNERKNRYEHISILAENLKEEEVQDEIKKYKAFFKDNNIEINSFENLGLKKLAYEIKGNKQGNYIFVELKATQQEIQELEKFARTNENTIRFIDVKTEDYTETQEDEENEEEER